MRFIRLTFARCAVKDIPRTKFFSFYIDHSLIRTIKDDRTGAEIYTAYGETIRVRESADDVARLIAVSGGGK